MFLCKGISESASRDARKKREKSLQFGVRLGKTRFNALKGVVSADGDGERSSGVDDLARKNHHSRCLLELRGVICGCMFHMVSSLYLKGRSQ